MLKKWFLISLKILFSVALIGWAVSGVDPVAAKERILQMAPEMILPVALVFALQFVIGTFRWRTVLGSLGAPLAFKPGLRLFYIGAFFNQTLPASVGGDAVRTYLAYRHGVKLRGAINGVMLERVATVAGLVLLVAAVLPAFLQRVGADVGGWMAPSVMIILAVLVAGTVFVAFLDRLPQSYHRWRIVRGLSYLADDTRKVFFAPWPLFKALGWGMLGHANLVMVIYLLTLALDLNVSLLDCFALFLPVLLVISLPISIAGWGVREQGMIFMFGMVGVPSDGALVLSILFGLFALVVSLPGGLVWLASGVRGGDVKEGLSAGPLERESS
ncbi:MAG: flippase-like domain-containing protein [Rhodospirillales bacterium]|jgi:glycosyltransferase 2 family protein|nr:flippase-like domain-containing protein [Rhodospirillales bacterium]